MNAGQVTRSINLATTMPPNTTHVSSANASPICSAPRSKSFLWLAPSPLSSSPPTKHAIKPLPPAACAAAEKAQALAAYVDAQHVQPIGAEDKADPGEHDRTTNQGPFDAAGHGAVNEKERGQN